MLVLRRTMVLFCLTLCWAAGARGDARTDMLKQIGIDQHIGDQMPADLTFKDETGRTVHLGDYFHGDRPIIFSLVYFKCPMLCSTVLNEMVISMNTMPLNMGEHYDVLTVSFSPQDTVDIAALKRKNYLEQYKHPGSVQNNWHFLVGDQSQIDQITNAVGFSYVADPSIDPNHPKDMQFMHPSGIMVLTPTGKISKYFYGINYAPLDLRLALLDAGQEKNGTLADAILLACFHYDPASGLYTLAILRMLKWLGAATMLVIGFFWIRWMRDEARQRRTLTAPAGPSILS